MKSAQTAAGTRRAAGTRTPVVDLQDETINMVCVCVCAREGGVCVCVRGVCVHRYDTDMGPILLETLRFFVLKNVAVHVLTRLSVKLLAVKVFIFGLLAVVSMNFFFCC